MNYQTTDQMCSQRRYLDSRRSWLTHASCGFGWLAFSSMATRAAMGESSSTVATSEASQLIGKQNFPAKAKHVIFLSMKGGPSHVDTFDYKPELQKADGQEALRPNSKWKASPWKFKQSGESGLWLSELFPSLATQTDKLCMIHSMQTDVPAHAQATVRMHTGSTQFVRPSVGAWTVYGLGTGNENLPGFVAISPNNGSGGTQNYGSAFLPANFQATRIGAENRDISKSKVANITPIVGMKRQRAELDFIQAMNEQKLAADVVNSEVEGAIKSYELAFRMQGEMPEAMDISKESDATQKMYGLDSPKSAGFGAKCLVARRLVESGVRFVEVTHGNWDHHFDLENKLPESCEEIDKGMAGLLQDLEKRGLLEETLVVWSGEFGRTPYAQAKDGRDHNHKAFTLWMAGGDVKGGMSYGSSGEFGYEATENAVPVVDFHATLLALLGMDHEKLTYRYAGRDFRLTDVKGRVVRDLMNV